MQLFMHRTHWSSLILFYLAQVFRSTNFSKGNTPRLAHFPEGGVNRLCNCIVFIFSGGMTPWGALCHHVCILRAFVSAAHQALSSSVQLFKYQRCPLQGKSRGSLLLHCSPRERVIYHKRPPFTYFLSVNIQKQTALCSLLGFFLLFLVVFPFFHLPQHSVTSRTRILLTRKSLFWSQRVVGIYRNGFHIVPRSTICIDMFFYFFILVKHKQSFFFYIYFISAPLSHPQLCKNGFRIAQNLKRHLRCPQRLKFPRRDRLCEKN